MTCAKFYSLTRLRESRCYFLMKKSPKCNYNFTNRKIAESMTDFLATFALRQVRVPAAEIILVVSEEISLRIYESRKYGNDQVR